MTAFVQTSEAEWFRPYKTKIALISWFRYIAAMFKVITFNANGIRSAARKGFYDWVLKQNADVICLQETRAQMQNIHDEIFYPEGYFSFFSNPLKKGYSGVGIYCKRKPDNLVTELGFELADEEGRYLQVDFGKLSIASIYIPSGTSGEARQALKMHFLKEYTEILRRQLAEKRQFIICGDVNIVHKEIDIKNWKSNQKNSGCLPEERAWLDLIFEQVGWVDAFRVVNKKPDQYTWWSHFGRAYERNVGWRIDYQIVSSNLKNKIKSAEIYKEQKFSDHAPVIIQYEL